MNALPLSLPCLAACFAFQAGFGAAQQFHVFPQSSDATVPDAKQADAMREIDVAICLDISGSMDGLIDSARQKLWAIVNDLALAEPKPKLRVALLTYGNDGHNPENGWVKVEADLTDDLDLISRRLFALTTNGGTELVARVIRASCRELSWHPSDDAMKLIIVAGNESANQDRLFSFRDECRAAITKGIMINSIYCQYSGDSADVESGWREVAHLADGHFAKIDQNNGTIVIATPFDTRLIELNVQLNETYIAYGSQGQWGASNQAEQDANAAGLNSEAAAQRCITKSTALYCNRSWDLVDAIKTSTLKLDDLKEADLPENMRSMSFEQRKTYVDQMTQKRIEIQLQVQTIMQQREAFVANQLKLLSLDETAAFDFAVRSAIRKQAEAKGFTFRAMTVPNTAGAQQPRSPEAAAPEAEFSLIDC